MLKFEIGDGENVFVDEDNGVFIINPKNWIVSANFFKPSGTVDDNGMQTYKQALGVPESCIESAEYILQVTAGASTDWVRGKEREPYMIAAFGNKTLNATTGDFVNEIDGVTDYDFNLIPNVGQGIVIANSGIDDDGYNMHFGAVFARHKTKNVAIISNLCEKADVKLINPCNFIFIDSVDSFKTQSGLTETKFKLGFLHV